MVCARSLALTPYWHQLSLVVSSESLVLFGDGIESDRLTLTWGQSVQVSRAPRALSLVDPAGLR